MKKAFTIIELLIVIAIISILSSIILVSLNSGKEKAQEAVYISYAIQMFKGVEAAVAMGDLSSIPAGTIESGCLGNYTHIADENRCANGAARFEGDPVEMRNLLTKHVDSLVSGANISKNKNLGLFYEIVGTSIPPHIAIYAMTSKTTIGATTDYCNKNFGNIKSVSSSMAISLLPIGPDRTRVGACVFTFGY
jgi:prepilin-type N-terminal cleavage/methylation domain-containing protein